MSDAWNVIPSTQWEPYKIMYCTDKYLISINIVFVYLSIIVDVMLHVNERFKTLLLNNDFNKLHFVCNYPGTVIKCYMLQ